MLENNSSSHSTALSTPTGTGGVGQGQGGGQGGGESPVGVGGVTGGTIGERDHSQQLSSDSIQLYGTFLPPTPSIPPISSSTSPSTSSSSAPRLLNKGELYSTIESYLLSGRREEAVSTAVLHKEWTLALLISSNCGEEEYREVSKAFAVATFPSSSPMHLAALLFSNQVRFGTIEFKKHNIMFMILYCMT